MVENKNIPSEYVSIRQVWLRQIDRCNEAISNRAKPDSSREAEWQDIGSRTVVYSVKGLCYTLIDYGEAKVKTEVTEYRDKVINPKLKEAKSWGTTAGIYQDLFEMIIETLNKYGLLFETSPRGYSNVEMISIGG